MSPAVDLRMVYQFLPQSAQQVFWDEYGLVSEQIQQAAKLGAIYSSITIVWYAHQVGDQSLLTEGLTGLSFLRRLCN